MFCPLCKCEYRHGFTTCADCEVPLVAEHPAVTEQHPEHRHAIDGSQGTLVPVFETHDQAQIALTKSALDASGIIYHFSAESFHMMGVRPLPARLLVASDQLKEVLVIMRDLGFIT